MVSDSDKDLATAILAREAIPEQDKWRLEDLFTSLDQWEQEFQQLPAQVEALQPWQGKIGISADNLAQVLVLRDQVMQRLEKLYVYAKMQLDGNNSNQQFQALLDRAGQLATSSDAVTAFLVPELLAIAPEQLWQWVDQDQRLHSYRHYLEDLQRQREHILSAAEEAILARASDMGEAPGQIYGMLTNSDMQFPPVTDGQGRQHPLSQARLIQLLQKQDRELRRNAFTTFYNTFSNFPHTLAAAYNGHLKRNMFYMRVRRYPSVREASLFSDNVPVDVYDNLITSVSDGLAAFQRYQRFRQTTLGLDRQHIYDLYVPLVEEVHEHISYQEAQDTILQALAPLGEEYLQVVRQAFTDRWIDVRENKGKTSGAYAWGAYGVHPYILLNYQDDFNSLFTLAHELGHALHSYYSNRSQHWINAQYTIFVAEVASTVNEQLLLQHLLKTTGERQVQRYLLNHYLEEFRGTVYRQTMFAEFEREVHNRVERGEAMTYDTLCGIYSELLRKHFGDTVELDQGIELEWARIPHFYHSFYVYKYATGFSAATALSQQILQQGQPAVERYLQFLSSGGSEYPLELLRRAGVDMASPEPVRQAITRFAEVLDQIEAM